MSRGKTSNKRVKKVLVRVSIFNDALKRTFLAGEQRGECEGGFLCMEAKLVRFFCGVIAILTLSKCIHLIESVTD